MSDFRREYGMAGADLARIDVHEFRWLLNGLSEASRFARAWSDEPKHLYDPAERAAVLARARA